VKFKQLQIENFLAITEATIAMADRGLCLIQGENQDDTSADSNGAGKSSIADALCWALYGTTARGVSGDDVINDKAGKGCMVGVRIEDGADTFIIRRHRKHKTGKNSVTIVQLDFAKPGVETDLTLGTDRLTQDRIDKIIGCPYEVFRAAVYAGQEQMPDLPAMTDKQLKLLLEEAAGVSLLEEAYADARKRLAAKTELYDKGVAHISRIESNQVAELARLSTIQASETKWQTEQTAKIDYIKREIADLREKIIAADKAYDTTRLPAIESALAEISKKVSGIKEEKGKLSIMDKAVADAVLKEASFNSDITRSRNIVAKEKGNLSKVHSEIGCPCPECARPLTAVEVEPRQKVIEVRIAEERAKIERLKQRQEDAHKVTQKLADERNVFSASMTDATVMLNQQASLMREKQNLRDQLGRMGDQRRLAVTKLDAMKALIAEKNPYSDMIAGTNAMCNALRDELDAAQKAQKVRSRDMEIAKSVAKVFSPAGVRAHILDEITPFLNGQTAKYLGALSDGNISATWSTLSRTTKGELRERFVIEVENTKGAKSFHGLSGGEKRKVRIACALALQDLVARRAVKPIELFIGDEIDDALDGHGLERLMGILEEKAMERGSVFVISHRSLRDWISNMLLVVKTDKGSTVEEVAL
jgi:DNA repair exonuclease SbcCD ATPase subunit